MQSKQQARWSGHVAAWRASGTTQAAYCRAHDLSLASFGYWRSKLAGGAAVVPAVRPIRVAVPAQDVAVEDVAVEVRLPGGTLLAVPRAEPAWLAALLRALGAC